MNHEKVYLLTDGCMWEANKRNGTSHPHSIEVVDTKTGAIQYITSGSYITFVKGKITDIRTQETYNEVSSEIMPRNKQGMPKGAKRKVTR